VIDRGEAAVRPRWEGLQADRQGSLLPITKRRSYSGSRPLVAPVATIDRAPGLVVEVVCDDR